MRLIRPLGRTFAKSARAADLILKGHNVATEDILGSLDANSEIPNKTDLAGAQPMTAMEVSSLLADLTTVASVFGGDTQTALFIKAAGINAVIE